MTVKVYDYRYEPKQNYKIKGKACTISRTEMYFAEPFAGSRAFCVLLLRDMRIKFRD